MKIVDPQIEGLAGLAAEIAQAGFPVFPCGVNKAPMCAHGHLDATDHPTKAFELFMAHPDARLIGVPMGSKAMLICVDVDPDGMNWLRFNWYRLGDTLIHQTPRGGVHLIYRMPKVGPIIDCRQVVDGKKLLSMGVDIKGQGGYIIWSGPKYSVINDVPPAEMPVWLRRRLLRKPKPVTESTYLPDDVKGLQAALAKVEHTLEGNRNNLLFWAACRAGELIKKGTLDESKAIEVCVASGKKAGLPEMAAWRTVKSGIGTGKRGG